MITPDNRHFAQHWHLKLIQVEDAWQLLDGGNNVVTGVANELIYGSPNVIVGIIDTGVQTRNGIVEHQGLTNNVSNGNPKSGILLDEEFPFVTGNDDSEGIHGTEVAGILTAKASDHFPPPNDKTQIEFYNGTGVVGVAPNIRFHSVSRDSLSKLIGFWYYLAGMTEIARIYADRSNAALVNNTPTAIVTSTLLGGVHLTPSYVQQIDNNSISFDHSVDIINLSIVIKPRPDINNTTFSLVFEQLMAYSRKGRGIIFCTGAGNGNVSVITEQALGFYDYPLIVGATAIHDDYFRASNPKPIEERAQYSNHGNELDIVAPSGDLRNNYNRKKQFTTTIHQSGKFHTNSPLRLQIRNVVSNSELELDNVRGVFSGQHVSIGDPDDPIGFEIRRITSIVGNTITLNQDLYYIRQLPGYSTNPANNATNPLTMTPSKYNQVEIAVLYTTLTSAVAASNVLPVANTKGFAANQQVYIGTLGNSSIGNSYTINPGGVNNAANTITINTAININAAALGSTYIVPESPQRSLAGRGVIDAKTFELDDTEGLFVGGELLLNFNHTTLVGGGTTTTTTTLPSEEAFIRAINGNVVEVKTTPFPPPFGLTMVTGYSGTVKSVGFGNCSSDFVGTSGATPVVSGVAALMLSAKSTLNVLEVKEILKGTTDKIDINRSGSGRWLDDASNSVTSFSNVTTVANAAPKGATSVVVANSTGLMEDHAVEIDGSENVIDSINGNTINLQYPLQNNVRAGRNVRLGGKPAKSQFYGAGRINARKAVQAAIDYSHIRRKLLIRDRDVGVTGGPINSPDIWIRLNNNSGATQLLQSGYGLHVHPDLNLPQTIHIRVINNGTTDGTNQGLPSLPGGYVRCFLAFTNQVNPSFEFPNKWYQKYNDNGENVIWIGTANMSATINSQDQVIVGNPATWNEQIFQINWDTQAPLLDWKKINPKNLNAYILVHIAPFDGEDNELSLVDVAQNKQLTYKPIAPFYAQFRDNTDLHLKTPQQIEVPTNGNTVSYPFKVNVYGVHQNDVAKTYLRCTLTKADGTSKEVVHFKDEGGGAWGYDPDGVPTWISVQTPAIGNVHIADYRNLSFECGLIVDKRHSNVLLEVVQELTPNNITVVETQQFQLSQPAKIPQGIQQRRTQILHTFTDFSTLQAQTDDQAYGPVKGHETTQFRTASLFRSIKPQKAYAVAGGSAFIQEITANGVQKINLILKPDQQPIVNGLVVKYFVYRGLKKSSFLKADGSVLLEAEVGDNDMLKRMWQVKNEWNQQETVRKQALSPPQAHTAQNLVREDLGLTITSDGEAIDKVFAEHTFQPIVEGWSLGEFDISSEFGFEIMVDYPAHQPTLEDIKILDHLIVEPQGLSDNPQAANTLGEYDKLYAREKVLAYVDPAAYYGLFYASKIKNHVGDTITAIKDESIKTLVIDKFFTKSSIYLDIRNELGNSINLYSTYKAANKYPKIKLNGDDVDYAYHGWPIVRIPSDALAEIRCQLPPGNNGQPMLYLSSGAYPDIGTPPVADSNQFKVPVVGNNTGEFLLKVPKQGAQVFPFHFKIAYNKRYAIPPVFDNAADTGIMRKMAKYDTIFPFNQIPIYPVANSTVWNTTSNLKYLGLTSLDPITPQDFNLQIGVAKDSIGETRYGFVKLPIEIRGMDSYNAFSHPLGLEGGKSNQRTLLHYFLSLGVLQDITKETDAGLAGVDLLRFDLPLLHSTFQSTMDQFYSISYTTAEAEVLNTLATTSKFIAGYPVYFVFQNGEYNSGVTNKFKLALQGVVKDESGAYRTHIAAPTSDIWCYAFSGNPKNFFTDAYAKAWQR
ncbi:hypothetical protein BKI52_37030 [marine bacterium AO1-C]|nr:hypothetical protein BKI52_37030 [marine bacterium AO1-C]